jgi:hypothetical protein
MSTENIKREMRRVKIGHVALLCAGVFVAFAIIGTTLLAIGGTVNRSFDFWRNVGFRTLANADSDSGWSFEVDDLKEQDLSGIGNIKITSVSTDIVLNHGGDKAQAYLKGRCRNADEAMRLEVDRRGKTLDITVKYPLRSRCSGTNLTVTLPDAYHGDMEISTVSGDLKAEDLPLTLGRIKVKTTSGNAGFSTTGYGEFIADTTSGDLVLRRIAAPVKLNSVSGDISLDYTAFAVTRVKTVSGDVKAAVPEDAAFTVDFQSVSGNFRSTHPGLNVGRAGKTFHSAVRDGGLFEIRTVSGNFAMQSAG